MKVDRLRHLRPSVNTEKCGEGKERERGREGREGERGGIEREREGGRERESLGALDCERPTIKKFFFSLPRIDLKGNGMYMTRKQLLSTTQLSHDIVYPSRAKTGSFVKVTASDDAWWPL